MSIAAPGRNNPCPCGRGRKFKHCCLPARTAEDSARLRSRGAEAGWPTRAIGEVWLATTQADVSDLDLFRARLMTRQDLVDFDNRIGRQVQCDLSLTFASWNQTAGCLRRLDALRAAAWVVLTSHIQVGGTRTSV